MNGQYVDIPNIVHAKILFGSTQVAASKNVSAASCLCCKVHTTPYNKSLKQEEERYLYWKVW